MWGSGEACCVVGRMRCKALEAVVWGSGEAFLCDLCRSRTSIFEVFAILGYVFHFCFHYMLHLHFISSVPRYFILSNFRGTFLISTYNMRLNFYSFLWLCTPIFHNFKMSGYARPNFSLFYTTYSLCLLKTYPDISFFLFFGVHMPKPPFISHNKYIVQFTQNLSKTLFITSFHKNNRPAFETRLYFFLHQKEAAH